MTKMMPTMTSIQLTELPKEETPAARDFADETIRWDESKRHPAAGRWKLNE
jgi:hypothetical protein